MERRTTWRWSPPFQGGDNGFETRTLYQNTGRNYGVVGHYDIMPSSDGFDPHRPTKNNASAGVNGGILHCE
jgi:hypothetical protein